jgi:hypothetical protein
MRFGMNTAHWPCERSAAFQSTMSPTSYDQGRCGLLSQMSDRSCFGLTLQTAIGSGKRLRNSALQNRGRQFHSMITLVPTASWHRSGTTQVHQLSWCWKSITSRAGQIGCGMAISSDYRELGSLFAFSHSRRFHCGAMPPSGSIRRFGSSDCSSTSIRLPLSR